MPDKQGIYNIEKQDAGRDIFNIVIQHLTTGKRVNLPSIQYVLRKGETTKGGFFKNEPEYIDFKCGYVVERREVDEIIKKIEHEKIQLVLGEPASGKSVILKNVGYNLVNKMNKAYTVYAVELKKHQGDEVKLYFEAIPEINDENAIFIVDDAHLYPYDCEKFVRDFKSLGYGKLIIGSRPTEEILPKHPKKNSEFKFLNKTEIHAEDVTEEMIRTFLEKQYHFDKEKINIVSSNLENYKNDLWQLSWALNAYKPEKDSVDYKEIYENIIVTNTEIETKNRHTISAEDVYLPLSIFYRYEIPTERDFLEVEMGIDGNIIHQLIGIQEIIETKEGGNGLLSFHHSSLAELYFGAYKKNNSFGKRIKNKILNGKDEKDLEYCLFYRYLTTLYPRNIIDVVLSLDRDFSEEKAGKTLLKKLIKIDKIQESIAEGIEKEEDLIKVGKCVRSIAAENEDLTLKLVGVISSKIKKEGDLIKVGRCYSDIAWVDKDLAINLIDGVSARIEIEEDIEKEEDIENVRKLMKVILWVDEEAALKLVDSVSATIEQEKDIRMIGKFLRSISKQSKRVGFELCDRIHIDNLSAKIEKEEDIREIGMCLTSIVKVNRNVAMRLVDKIDVDVISSKIEKEKDLEKVELFIRIITEISKDIMKRLVNSISARIEREDDIDKVKKFVLVIVKTDKDIGSNINETPSTRLDEEENMEYIEELVNVKINKDMIQKLVKSVSLRLDREDNIEKIGEFIADIAKANKKFALKFVNDVSKKLNEEKDIGKVVSCVSGISKESKEVAKHIFNKLNPKLREKVAFDFLPTFLRYISDIEVKYRGHHD